jgi:hypothetical protein
MATDLDYYVYPGSDGADVIVPRLLDVPQELRSKAKHIDLSKPALKIPAESPQNFLQETPGAAAADGIGGILAAFHGPSFLLGVGAAVALACLVVLSLRRTTRIFSLALGLVLMATFSLGYMTYLRKQAGLQSKGIPTPKVFIDDAKESAEAMKKRYADQEQILRDVEKQAGR